MTESKETCSRALLSPFDLHGLLLKNRVVMSPLLQNLMSGSRFLWGQWGIPAFPDTSKTR
jgi:2,4-dienoyl-CoA reductase-like NADH-dependent reductase (Old Yellow Enzyme family)